MNYLLKSKYKNPFKAKIITVISVSIILFSCLYFFPKSLRSFFTTISEPLWSIGDSMSSGTGSLLGFFSSKGALLSEISGDKDQISALKVKEMDYDAVLKENQDLKAEQNRLPTDKAGKSFSDRILSRVLSKPPQSPYDTFIIDVGQSEGSVVGSNVYISDTILIGTVTSVTAHSSIIELFSKGDKKNQFELSRTGSSYELSGRGGGNFVVEVPKDADILWGDVFTSPHLSTSVIGSVYYIETNVQSSFKKIYIRIPTNIFQTKWVYVEKVV